MHNKIYFLEFDHITHVAPETVSDEPQENSENARLVKIPGSDNRCKNETESLNLMYRDFLLCMANGAAMWWFDMFDGWFRTNGMMNAVRKMIGTAEMLSEIPCKSAAQIAVFAEGESMYRARKTSKLPTVCLSDIRRTLAECGAPYDLYSISDIALDHADNYQMYIFVNQYEISDKTRKYIYEKCVTAGKTVLWLYAPDYATDGQTSVDRILEITGINVSECNKSHGKLIYNENEYDYPLNAPYFSVQDESATPLATFEDESIAVAEKNIGNFKSVYCSTCNLPSELLRDIIDRSGLFVYSRNSRVYTYVNSAMIGVYNATGNDDEIHLRNDGTYTDLISDEKFICKKGIIELKNRDINAFLFVKE